MIDLHAHTTASDGSLTPAELVRLARERGLSALGVSDHDTVGGLEEASRAASEIGLDLVPGIELSVKYPHGQFHLLGYYVDFRDERFLDRVTFLQESRANRNVIMLEKLRTAGLNVTPEDIEAEAGGGQIGRPHMAMALVRKGYATDVQDAFQRYLREDGPLYVPKVRLSPSEAVDLVHQAGGVAVLAHPKYLRFASETALGEELAALQSVGLDGLECYYSQHSPEETEMYLRLARRLGLLVTSGSDFHGGPKPHVQLGNIYQGAGGDDALLNALKQAVGRA